MFSFKLGWYLPVTLFALSLLLYVSIELHFDERISGEFQSRSPNALSSVLSPVTIDALYEDDRFHNAVLSMTETVAKVSTKYGKVYRSEYLEGFGRNLTEEIARLRITLVPQKKKRGFLEDLGNLVTGGGGNDQRGQGDKGDNGTGGLGGLLQQGLAGLGNSLLQGAATPAYFLGIGIGMGAGTGLNLTSMDQAKVIATKMAASSNSEPTGANLVAQQLGSGLAGQLAPSIGDMAGDVDFGMVAFALAQGIGQGSASGLNLTSQQFAPDKSTDVMGIAKNIGLGVSGPIAGGIDFQKLMNQAGGMDIQAQVPQIAAAAGKGLGEGASSGLGLAKGKTTSLSRRQAAANPKQIDVPGAAGDFARGLGEALLGNTDLSKLGLGGALNSSALVDLASGAGMGAGKGIAVGLNLTTYGNVDRPVTAGTVSNITEQAAEKFTQGLVAGVLQNGGSSLLQNVISSQGKAGGIDLAKAAEGAARGLVEGTVYGMSMAGGVKKVIAGDFSPQLAMNLPPMPPPTFNDTVGGAAVSFTRGLTAEGALVIAQVLKNSSLPSLTRRSIGMGENGAVNQLKRQADSNQSMPLAVDGQTLGDVLQVGANAITCQGFGGLTAVANGLTSSGTVNLNGNGLPLDPSTLDALPKEPMTIISDGNKFTIQIRDFSITVNGLKRTTLITIVMLHALFTGFAFLYALPTYFALGALLRLSQIAGHPLNEASNKKWRKWILLGLFAPSAFVGFALGIVAMGTARHFRTVHGIIGLIAIAAIPLTVLVSFMRLRTAVPPPASSFFFLKQLPALLKGPKKIYLFSSFLLQQTQVLGIVAFIEGFADVRSISLCTFDPVLTAPIVVGLMNIIIIVQVGAMALVGLRVYLERRIAGAEKRGIQNGGNAAERGDLGENNARKKVELEHEPLSSERPLSL
ncbi:hypothetical protein DM02DRAFT_655863 [Periconia macrospinosa]|uniref:Cytochrome b561 domain-containing protein n=1 Tax=Periconia macrospinosa TaxID=97972 RepID=A0A2V1DRR4_9PLEO|nr:hypothetical protein DM02DRAFT_655863 [Periconia macrospinosa]